MECPAIVYAVHTLHPYLERDQSTVSTDHNRLRWLINLPGSSSRLDIRRLLVSELAFDIRYVKEAKNFLSAVRVDLLQM